MTQLPGTTFGLGTTGGYSVPFFQPFSTHPIQQQILQLLQNVPQQLQQLQAIQQQQSVQLQLLLQIVPAQLQQLQQLIQLVPQQLQQIHQGQPFGSVISSPIGFGLSPHVFGGQSPGQVM